MAGSTDVVVKFLADVTDISRGVKSIDSRMSGLGKTMRRVGLAVGAAFAVRTIAGFVNAAEEAEVANRRLEQTMKNAGDTTGDWARHAEDLADQLQRTTGIDDELIKGAQGILATFHGVSGEVGQSSGIFDRATKAAVDLSKTGFGDVDTAAKQLGKALQDPEKGLTALSRAGVQFTKQQKDQIKALVASGDQLGAMNIILGEVESQVGGVAEKTATAGDKMRVAWGETKEALGKALLPVLQQLAPLVEQLAFFVQQNATWLIPFTIGVVGVVKVLQTWAATQKLLNGLMATFGAETTIALGPIYLLIIAIVAVVAAVVVLYAKWDQVWSFIGKLPWYVKVAALILAITNPVTLLIAVASTLAVYWNDIWGRVSSIVGTAAALVTAHIKGIVSIVTAMVGAVAAVLGVVGRVVDVLLVQPFERAYDIISGIVDRITDVVGTVVDLAGKAKRAVESIPGVGSIIGAIPGLQAGGIVTRPTLAMLGEAGPEAVIPLSRGSSSAGGVTIVVNTTGLGADAPAIQSAVVAALRQYTTRNGPLPASITG